MKIHFSLTLIDNVRRPTNQLLMFSVYLKQSNHSIFFSFSAFWKLPFGFNLTIITVKKYNEIIFANNDVFQISEQIFLFINFFSFFRFYRLLNLQFRSQIMHFEQEAIIPLRMFEWVAHLRSTIKSVSPSHIKLHC